MADRKKPSNKKKHTKKIKKTVKKEEKKRKDKIKKSVPEISGSSVYRRKSSVVIVEPDSYEDIIRGRNIDDESSSDFERKISTEPIKKKSTKSMEFSHSAKSYDDYRSAEPIKKKSIEFARKYKIDDYSKDVPLNTKSKQSYDMYRRIKNMRNSRTSLDRLFSSDDREEAGEQSKIMIVPKEEKTKINKFDFVDQADYTRTHLKLAVIWMEICGITHLSVMIAYAYSENFLSISNYDTNTGCASNVLSHYIFGSIWIYVSGNAIIVFRVFNKSRTRSIKYFHLCLHSASYICCLLSIYAFYLHWKDMQMDKHNYSIHAKIGVISAISYLLQWLVGLFVYTMETFRQKFRIQFYHYHSYIGFVVFFMAVTTMCSGLVMEEKFSDLGFSSNRYTYTWLPRCVAICGIIFAGSVLFIIVYPYFDFAEETEPL